MDQVSKELILYTLHKNTISTITIPTLKVNKLRIPSDYLIQDILPIPNNRLIINGANRIEEVYKEHSIFIYDSTDMIEIDTHKFGIVGFKMIYSQDNIYFLSDRKCQVYNIASEHYRNVPDMLSSHIDPGCCSFNEGVLVIGGLNNRDIDLYSTEHNSWTNLGKLDLDIFSVSCIQISESLILIVNYQEFYKFDVKEAKIVFHGVLPIKSKSAKIANLVIKENFVYCVFGSSAVLKYSISHNKWTRMQKKTEGCCLLF